MRSTLRIDDDLMNSVKAAAHEQGVSITRMLNKILRIGLEAVKRTERAPKKYSEEVFRMGCPEQPLDKALSISTALEDEEILRKIALRK